MGVIKIRKNTNKSGEGIPKCTGAKTSHDLSNRFKLFFIADKKTNKKGLFSCLVITCYVWYLSWICRNNCIIHMSKELIMVARLFKKNPINAFEPCVTTRRDKSDTVVKNQGKK